MQHYLKTVDPGMDFFKLPDAARRELITFYEFLIFKYQVHQDIPTHNKRKILTAVFRKADGKLPPDYKFDREEIHER